MRLLTKESGFTIVEVAVVVPIMILIALGLFQALFTMVQSTGSEQARINLSYEKQIAMDNVEADVRLTATFIPTLDTGLTDKYQNFSNGGPWSYKGSSASFRTLILRSYSTTANPLQTERDVVYVGTPASVACSSAYIGKNPVLSYNTIYFVKDGTLYRRRIVDTSTATCILNGQYQKTSCPSLAILGTPSRDASCKADDEVIATDVSSFTVAYYLDGSSPSPINAYGTGVDPQSVTAARSVDITIGQTRTANAQDVSSSIDLRMATLNAQVTGGN